MTDKILITIVLVHFLADFALQTHEQALGKSKEIKWLLYHTGTYSIMWLLGAFIFLNWWQSILFAVITFVAHTITDYFTSRLTSKLFERKDFHNGFVVVGFDQVLHFLQLYYTFKIFL